jgi:DNA-binding XRE family transcriptional regulator
MSEQIEGLFIDVSNVDEKEDLVNRFPLLKRYEEFSTFEGTPGKELNRNKVIRYINLLYSAKSGLVKMYKDDLAIRKEEAAKFAGFEKKEMAQVEKDLYELNNEKVVKMIMRFLLIQNVRLWTTICSIEQSFYQTNKLLMSPLGQDYGDAVKQKPLRAELIDMNQQLDALYDKMFNDNSDVKKKLDSNDELRRHLNPEQVALKLK